MEREANGPEVVEATGKSPLEVAIDDIWRDVILSNRPNYGDWGYGGEASRHITLEHTDIRDALKDCLVAMYKWGQCGGGLPDDAARAYLKASKCLVNQWPSDIPRV